MLTDVSAAVVNYQTPDLLTTAVRSFKQHYPNVPLLIIENGSDEESRAVVAGLESTFPGSVSSVINPLNIFHGPAMDQALRSAGTPFVYLFDSDTETHTGGFLEAMLAMIAEDRRTFAVGKRVTVNKRGFLKAGGIPVPVSAYMLIRREMYLQLSPFGHHGLPVLRTCVEAARKGWRVAQYPVDEYVEHLGRGTASEFGYGLGWKGRLNYVLNRLGI